MGSETLSCDSPLAIDRAAVGVANYIEFFRRGYVYFFLGFCRVLCQEVKHYRSVPLMIRSHPLLCGRRSTVGFVLSRKNTSRVYFHSGLV